MTKEEYLSLAYPQLQKLNSRVRTLFLELINLGDKVIVPKSKVRHHIESSFDNNDALNLVKLGHLFRYPYFGGVKSSRDFIRHEFLLNFVNKINKVWGINFDLELLNAIFRVPILPDKENGIISFSCEYDCSKKQFRKISVHINPAKTSSLSLLLIQIGHTNRNAIPVPILRDRVEFLGFDFLREKRYNLKIYQRFNHLFKDNNIAGGKQQVILNKLDKLRSQKNILLMYKFNSDVCLTKPFGVYLFCGDNFPCRDLLDLGCLKSYTGFIRNIGKHIKDLKIFCIALKDHDLELYIR